MNKQPHLCKKAANEKGGEMALKEDKTRRENGLKKGANWHADECSYECSYECCACARVSFFSHPSDPLEKVSILTMMVSIF